MRHFYRYLKFNTARKSLDWKNKRLERIFTHNELYFASPSKFNDPFDCKTLFTCEGSGVAEFGKFFEGKLKHDYPNLSAKKIKQKASALIRKGFYKETQWRKYHIGLFEKITESEIEKLGMLCLSEKRDDILMWSHYAAGHTGFCLEFDKEGFKSWNYCEPIQYRQTYPTCKEFVDKIDSKALHYIFLLRKSEHWKYEKEWRVIIDCENLPDRILKFPDRLLTGIILGCQMPKAYEDLMLRWYGKSKHRLRLYRAIKKENEYGLRMEEIK
jgi:hypothetical protein